MDIKLKNKILVIGFVTLLFIVYKFTISKTFETQKMVAELTTEKLLLSNISTKISSLQNKELQLDAILKKRNILVNNSFQQTLLQNVTSFVKKNKLQILSFNQPHSYSTDITKLTTYSFEIKGDFISLLRMVNFLGKLQLGELITINFEKKNSYRNKTSYLTCSILLQKNE